MCYKEGTCELKLTRSPKGSLESDKRRILYLEDHDDSRTFTTFLLKGAGYQVTSIASMAEAQPLLDQPAGSSSFDCYILDFLLKDGAGTTLCQQIRALDAAVPIVFVSGAVREQDKQRAKDAGATHFFEKPLEHSHFLETLARLSR